MGKVTVKEAKTRFSQLLRRVAAGEEITIVNRDVAVARLVPVTEEQAGRKLGMFRGQMRIPEDFDVPLPEHVLRAFEGKRRSLKQAK